MTSFRITLAYDGTGFVGWQRQASGTSIQGLLEDALGTLDDRDVTVAGAGRTDAGVHACGQVASFSLRREIAPDTLVGALNANLPDAVRVLSAGVVPAQFHPRFSARRKTYRYGIWTGEVMSPFERRYLWHVPGVLDVDAMDAAARLLVGTHDFAAFQSSGSETTTTVRTLFSSRVTARGSQLSALSSSQRGTLLTYDVVGDGFLRRMVRSIVGSLVEVGRGRRPPAWLGEVLAACDRARSGPTAPAAGLFLVSVDYEADVLAAQP